MANIRLTVNTFGVKAGVPIYADDEIAAGLVASGQATYVPDDEMELELEVDLGTVAGVLEQVGDDKVKARAALDAERSKGEAARITLVSALEAIVAD